MIYVGKTTKTIEDRFEGHVYDAFGRKSKTYLCRSVRKYGVENFKLEKLCKCVRVGKLDLMEKFFIKKLKSSNREFGYNLTLGGEGGVPNEETRAKMGRSGELNNNFGGKSITENQKVLAKINSIRQFSDPEARKRVSEQMKGNIPWNKGLKKGDKYKGKDVSELILGGLKNKGKKRTEEWKKIRSEKYSGVGHPLFGSTMSEETKRKIGESQKQRFLKLKNTQTLYSHGE